ncbi:MAG: TonB-dependent receptor [Bacteroidota bacterium]
MRPLLSALLVLLAPLAAAQTGGVAGRVTDAATGSPLPGATVRLLDGQGALARGAATDVDGAYRLGGVPAGTYTLAVSYLGYAEARQPVTVASGATVRADASLAPEATELGAAVVLGTRAQGQAVALQQQREAANIRNVISADQIGRFPDVSAPEALQRVPGIGVQRDQGDGRFLQIRGASPQFTTVTFNGERIPSPEGDVRQIALDAVPTEVLQAVEVSKAITPDMDADAIGGSVNLVTRRAPPQFFAAGDLAGGYSALRADAAGRGSLTLGARTPDGRIGVIAGASLNNRAFGSDDLEPEYDLGDDDVPSGDDALAELQARWYDLVRERTGGHAAVDYALAPGQTLFLRGVFSQLRDTEQRRRGIFVPDDGEVEYTHKNRTERLQTLNLTAGGEHAFVSGLEVDYRLTFATSEEDTPEDIEVAFIAEDVAFGAVSLADPDRPALGLAGGLDASAFAFDAIEPASSLTTNTDYVGALNVSVPFALAGGRSRVQVGGKVRLKRKDQDVTEAAFEDLDLTLAAFGDASFEDVFGEGYDYVPGDYPLPGTITSDDQILGFVDRFRGDLEADDAAGIEGDLEDFDAREDTYAAYAMAELNVGPLLVLPGARFEVTDVESTGFESVIEEEVDADGDVSTDLLGVRAATATNDYGYLFPMLHLRYRATPRTNVRAAVTTALARPNFFDLAPYRIQDDDEVEIGNPALVPARSVNLDLLAEHFLSSIGVVSGGVFYKRITSPIVSTRFEETSAVTGEELEVTQSVNGESGTIFGVEVAVQQQLRFLPGSLAGLGVYANYTYTQSDATLADGSDAVFPGQADHLANLALSYEAAGFSGQVSYNYTGRFLDEFGGDGVGADRAADLFVRERHGLDAQASFQVTPRAQLFAEAVNLLNAPLVVFQGIEARPIQREFYRPSGWIGVRLTY